MADQTYEEVLNFFLKAIDSVNAAQDPSLRSDADAGLVPVGISNRHVHLTHEDMEALFGKGHALTNIKDLGQPGQYACKEVVTLAGPKGVIEKVRVLGPERKQTQVEILAADGFKLGVKAPVRLSGDLDGTPGLTLIGPAGAITIPQGVMVAQRHIHMSLNDAYAYGVHDGQEVSLAVDGPRGGTMDHVLIRANATSALECHVDTEEANALGINSKMKLRIIK
jgi:putative phosphotransacetylase